MGDENDASQVNSIKCPKDGVANVEEIMYANDVTSNEEEMVCANDGSFNEDIVQKRGNIAYEDKNGKSFHTHKRNEFTDGIKENEKTIPFTEKCCKVYTQIRSIDE